ncbi:pentatricopeptide repeat-containing protein At1g01970-like [Aristolochia californica]|uniref:pentatricopeptide repeat-containing protein At1g01970-like n=1 Tax=Aristolochia californica TaxID=171875 RepID=UPI0035E04540
MLFSAPPSVSNLTTTVSKIHYRPSPRSLNIHPRFFHFPNSSFQRSVLPLNEELEQGEEKEGEERPKLRWPKLEPTLTEEQKLAISRLPPKMSKRCRALMERLICSSLQGEQLFHLLSLWVKIMKPRRADWLSVLKEMDRMDSPVFLEVMDLALLEESFEANIRDYTKLIHKYSKSGCMTDAENAVAAMKRRGFSCDQVTLTVLLDMYSKAGNLNRAEEIFEEIKLLGLPVDKRSYGSMIMAYVRAGMPKRGEKLKMEMEAQDVCAGKEIHKAMLRAYSIAGDTDGAQRIFDSIQLAGIIPDAKLCALLINAYCVAGQSEKARSVLENLRSARMEPSDKCVALLLAAYEKDNNLDKALGLLLDLEKDGFLIGEEASQILAKWLRRLGVLQEIETVLRGGKVPKLSH